MRHLVSLLTALSVLVGAVHSGLAIGWNVDGTQSIVLCKGATLVTVRLTSRGVPVPEVEMCPDGLIAWSTGVGVGGMVAPSNTEATRFAAAPAPLLDASPHQTPRARAPPRTI